MFTNNDSQAIVNWLEDTKFTQEFIKNFCEKEKWYKYSMANFLSIFPTVRDRNLSLEDFREISEYFNEKYYV